MAKNRWKQSNRCCQSESLIPNRFGTEILSFVFLSLGMSEISFHHWSGTDNLLSWVSQHLFRAQIFLHAFPLSLPALGFWSLCESNLLLLDALIKSIFWLEGFCWVTADSPLLQRFNPGVPQPWQARLEMDFCTIKHINTAEPPCQAIHQLWGTAAWTLWKISAFVFPCFWVPGCSLQLH